MSWLIPLSLCLVVHSKQRFRGSDSPSFYYIWKKQKVMMRTILEIYFGVGLIVLGGTLENGKVSHYFISIFFGLPILVAEIAWSKIIKPFKDIFQLKFYWNFYFRNGFRNLTIEKLELMNSLEKSHWNKKTLRHRIWRHGLKLINKANNFKQQ